MGTNDDDPACAPLEELEAQAWAKLVAVVRRQERARIVAWLKAVPAPPLVGGAPEELADWGYTAKVLAELLEREP
jgi:hypothetical protein